MPESSVMPSVEPESTIHERSTCRACGGGGLREWLDLGEQPLANRLLKDPDEPEPFFPLKVRRCQECGLSQLSHIVAPEMLYDGYLYASGVSEGWKRHEEGLLQALGEPHSLLDIASNDGTLVKLAIEKGWDALGVEPSPIGDYPVIKGFWPVSLDRKYDVIVAQNVFGHVDKTLTFLQACEAALAPNGIVVVECPDVLKMLTETQFDTIYHEHLSYWGATALATVAREAKLFLVKVEPVEVHGGSLRYTLSRNVTERDASVRLRVELEDALFKPQLYRHFNIRLNTRLTRLANELREAEDRGETVWAYGASAKSTVLFNCLRDRGAPLPELIVDDSPLKQNLFSPGVHLPIRAEDLSQAQVLLLTAWNWAKPMQKRAREAGFQGRFLLP